MQQLYNVYLEHYFLTLNTPLNFLVFRFQKCIKNPSPERFFKWFKSLQADPTFNIRNDPNGLLLNEQIIFSLF